MNQQLETWIHLPKSRRPTSWDKIKDPVCKLKRNLYGHPIAGLIWEKHCQKAIFSCGFKRIPGWECLFVHFQKKLFLSVYVDDFRMAGLSSEIQSMWKLLGQALDLDPAVPSYENTYLGCNQHVIQPPESVISSKKELLEQLTNPAPANSDLHGDEHAERELEPKSKSKKKKTKKKGKVAISANNLSQTNQPDIKAWVHDMIGHSQQCVERYIELANKPIESLTNVQTPCIDDHQFGPDDLIEQGELAEVAAKIVLKALYLARLARPDILWTVNALARTVTKWTKACDKRLHRLISYLHFHSEWTQLCYMGDYTKDCWIALFTDASFAGDLLDSKSTSGAYMCLVGPRTFVLITWLCKKQGAVSHSSSEAEVIALDASLRMEGLPALILWDIVITVFHVHPQIERSCNHGIPGITNPSIHEQLLNVDYIPCNLSTQNDLSKLIVFEDNQAVITMTKKGRSPNMRHVPRTHRVNLDWIFERIREDKGVNIQYVGTKTNSRFIDERIFYS